MNRFHNNDWVERPLSEVFWFQEGPGVRKWQFTNSGIKLLNVANITTTGTIDLKRTDRHLSVEEVERKYKHFLIDAGDLVIASSGVTFDADGMLRTKSAFVQEKHLPLCMNTSTIRFKPKNSCSNLRFLRFWFDSLDFRRQITKLVTGSAQQNFGPSHLELLRITLPSVPEQKCIVEILENAEKFRSQRRYVQELCDGFLQSAFLQMFERHLQDNQQTKSLGELCTITGGGTPSRENAEYYKGDIPWVTAKDMRADFISDAEEHISKDAISKSATKEVPAGSILVVVKSKVLMHRLPLAINQRALCHNQDIKSIQCNEEVNPHFLFYVLRHNERRLLAQARGANTEGLNLDMLQSVLVPDVPLKLQETFAKLVERFQRLRIQQGETLRQSEHLFGTLLHRAFRGEL